MLTPFLQIIVPTSDVSFRVHAKGISDLIQLLPPDFYASGISHKLFVGIRPVLVHTFKPLRKYFRMLTRQILHAFETRTSTFLAADEWKSKPFALVPAVPLQVLMNEAIAIP